MTSEPRLHLVRCLRRRRRSDRDRKESVLMSEPLKGQRHDDPPKQGLAYRAALAIEKYPVLFGATIALAVATVALAVVLKQQNDLRFEKASNIRLNSAALASCHRLQTVRDRQNHIGALLYLTFISGAQREQVLAKGPTGAIHALEAKIQRTLGNAARYTPPTNCRAAVSAPDTYKAPHPLPFTMARARQLEPQVASDLDRSSQRLIDYERRLLKSLEHQK